MVEVACPSYVRSFTLLADNNRIAIHPILPIPEREEVYFYWNGQKLKAKRGEMIASALIANGISIFGHHHKDGSAQGIFCANGQCSQCSVIANGIAVKSCMTAVSENMIVQSLEGLPVLPTIDTPLNFEPLEYVKTDVLIIGGGPAGLSAAIELGKQNIPTLLIDDKYALGESWFYKPINSLVRRKIAVPEREVLK